MFRILQALFGLLGAVFLGAACGPVLKLPFSPLPVGAQFDLVAAGAVEVNKTIAIEVSVLGKPVSAGEVAFFSDFSSAVPFQTENFDAQKLKSCTAAAVASVDPEFMALVFCGGSLNPSQIGRLEIADSSGTKRSASGIRFVRSDKTNGVDVFAVDFL